MPLLSFDTTLLKSREFESTTKENTCLALVNVNLILCGCLWPSFQCALLGNWREGGQKSILFLTACWSCISPINLSNPILSALQEMVYYVSNYSNSVSSSLKALHFQKYDSRSLKFIFTDPI